MYLVRGIVTAATAPYQIYKDLNPSTLTGAIDVIVVERRAENGETELVCSPFHVRFGKWQVLLPADKKVCILLFLCTKAQPATTVREHSAILHELMGSAVPDCSIIFSAEARIVILGLRVCQW